MQWIFARMLWRFATPPGVMEPPGSGFDDPEGPYDPTDPSDPHNNPYGVV